VAKLDDQVLGFSVSVTDPESRKSRSFPAGTTAREIPAEWRRLITNPRAWEENPALAVPTSRLDGAEVVPGVGAFVENDTAPSSLEDCDLDELREVARVHEIPIGALEDPAAIREVLYEAGIGEPPGTVTP